MGTKVSKYAYRNWAVWLILEDGTEDLIAVTVYKKGALRVKGLIDIFIRCGKEGK
jgi:hypothetical protein